MPGEWAGSTRSKRLPRDWQQRVAAVMTRDHARCYLCGSVGADTVDHIQRGDDHSMSNLAAVHDRNFPHCHRRKTSREGNAERWRPERRDRREPEQHPFVGFLQYERSDDD